MDYDQAAREQVGNGSIASAFFSFTAALQATLTVPGSMPVPEDCSHIYYDKQALKFKEATRFPVNGKVKGLHDGGARFLASALVPILQSSEFMSRV